MGITVERISTPADLRSYYSFAKCCSRRYGTNDLLFEAFEIPWRCLRPTGIFETFLACYQNAPIAGLSVWGYGDQVMEIGSYQSQEGYQRKLQGPDLIKWEIIKWAKEQGVLEYDLAGVNPIAVTHKDRGIRQFKEKWGGRAMTYLMVHS